MYHSLPISREGSEQMSRDDSAKGNDSILHTLKKDQLPESLKASARVLL